LPIIWNDNGTERYITRVGKPTAERSFDSESITHVFFMKDGKYEAVEPRAFYGNSSKPLSLIGVYLPDSITTIGNEAFKD
jgi:hypothetical protein